MKKLLVFLCAIVLFNDFAFADSILIHNPDNNHFYQRIDTRMSWFVAKDYCNDLGGYLATITSQHESDLLYKHLISTAEWEYIFIGGY